MGPEELNKESARYNPGESNEPSSRMELKVPTAENTVINDYQTNYVNTSSQKDLLQSQRGASFRGSKNGLPPTPFKKKRQPQINNNQY